MRLIASALARMADAEQRPDWVAAGTWRRCDPLTRLACCALARLPGREACDAATGLVVATSYGAVHATQRFVDSIASYGDAGASPTPFTTSVHNGSAGTIGQVLGLQGPCTTLAQGGTGCLAALRWAWLQLRAGRCPRVLVVAGEAHSAWSQRVVQALSASPWPVGSGCSAWLLEGDAGTGRELRLGEHPAARCLDGGGLGGDDRALAAAARAAGQERLRAPDRLGAWWPTATLAALPADDDAALQLRERDVLASLACWLGPVV